MRKLKRSGSFAKAWIKRLPPPAYRLPLTAYRLPLTAYRLPLTAYRLPLTAYRLPPPTLLLRRRGRRARNRRI